MFNSSSVQIKIPEHLQYFKNKENISPQQDDSMKNHSVMLAACTCEGKIVQPLIQ